MTHFQTNMPGFAMLAAMCCLAVQAQPGYEQRAHTGLEQPGSAMASGAGRYHLMIGGSSPGQSIVSALFDEIVRTRPASVGEVRALMQKMKIDSGAPQRVSMKIAVPRQTQGATFGERVAAGVRSKQDGGGAASVSYPATGRANAARDVVIIICSDPAEEQEALHLFASTAAGDDPKQTQARLTTRHDAVKTPVNNIRRETAPSGGIWLLVSEERSR